MYFGRGNIANVFSFFILRLRRSKTASRKGNSRQDAGAEWKARMEIINGGALPSRRYDRSAKAEI